MPRRSKKVPQFTSRDERHSADACTSLVQAVDAGSIRAVLLSGGHYPGSPVLEKQFAGLKMLGLWDTQHQQGWGLPWHRNEAIELSLLERGSLTCCTEEDELCLEPNDLLILRPWQRHKLGNPNISASRLHWILIDVGVRAPHQEWRWPKWIHLSPGEMQELTRLLRHNECPLRRGATDVARVFYEVAACISESPDGIVFSRLALRLNELFLVLLETLRKKDVVLNRSLTNSMRSVQLFLKDLRSSHEELASPWDTHSMAQHCGLGVTQFTRHVRSLTNGTPQQYLTERRLELAKHLLQKSPKAGVTQIAIECGFSSSQYFATIFAQWVGCTPREYRRQG